MPHFAAASGRRVARPTQECSPAGTYIPQAITLNEKGKTIFVKEPVFDAFASLGDWFSLGETHEDCST